MSVETKPEVVVFDDALLFGANNKVVGRRLDQIGEVADDMGWQPHLFDDADQANNKLSMINGSNRVALITSLGTTGVVAIPYTFPIKPLFETAVERKIPTALISRHKSAPLLTIGRRGVILISENIMAGAETDLKKFLGEIAAGTFFASR